MDKIKELEADIEALEAKLRDAALSELSALGQASEAYTAQLEAEAKLAQAVEEKLDAISTLNAWFDRRKIGHEAVDQSVIDAASGYLRTSRCGGMASEESDKILGVIQNMAHLGLFADLFARATLAAIKGEAE